jgi:hypothetical protein
VRTWLAQRPRYQIHYTPTYSLWLNQVERWILESTRGSIPIPTRASISPNNKEPADRAL